jgi:hypothetical protein
MTVSRRKFVKTGLPLIAIPFSGCFSGDSQPSLDLKFATEMETRVLLDVRLFRPSEVNVGTDNTYESGDVLETYFEDTVTIVGPNERRFEDVITDSGISESVVLEATVNARTNYRIQRTFGLDGSDATLEVRVREGGTTETTLTD